MRYDNIILTIEGKLDLTDHDNSQGRPKEDRYGLGLL